MTPGGNNDVYNHPQSEKEVNQQPARSTAENNKAEQKTAVNPNPRANENLSDKDLSTNENTKSNEAGSEITDGEDG